MPQTSLSVPVKFQPLGIIPTIIAFLNIVLIRSSLGKARAWLRLALMNKQLSDYFRLLLEQREKLLQDYYEEYALMMSDEAIVIGGLLVGLNILDCNLCLKEEDLDSNDKVIDLTSYLRDNIQEDSIKEWITANNVINDWYVLVIVRCQQFQ